MSRVTERNYVLDIARIVAVLAVVMIHVSAGFVTSYAPSSWEYVVGNVFDSFSRIGVPLFVMISGSLMLDEQRNITRRNIFRKYVKNILILLIFWSILYAFAFKIFYPFVTGNTISIKSFFAAFVFGHYHMWYLYMMIGLYMATPFLRAFTAKENQSLVRLFLLISLAVQFLLPISQVLSTWVNQATYYVQFIEQFNLDFFCGYTAYYLTGWYITHVGFKYKRTKHFIYFMGITSLLITIIGTQLTGDYGNTYSNMNLFVFLYSVGVYTALGNLKLNLHSHTKNMFSLLSRMTFGVYIIHPALLTVFCALIPYNDNSMPVFYILVSYVVVLLLSFVFSVIAAKIPFIKKFVRT